jgi:Heat shock protein 9/12
MTPDSSKSTLDRVKEGVTDVADPVPAEAHPDSHKGTIQSVFDKGKPEIGKFDGQARYHRILVRMLTNVGHARLEQAPSRQSY